MTLVDVQHHFVVNAARRTRHAGALVTWLVLSWALLWWLDLRPVAPTTFIVLIMLLAPTAYVLSLCPLLDQKLDAAGWQRLVPFLGVGLGAVTLALYEPTHPLIVVLDVLILVPLMLHLKRGLHPRVSRRLVTGLVLLGVAYWAIWNTNYLALHVLGRRSFDPEVRVIDEALYGWMAGQAIDYRHWFPLVRSSMAFTLLEHAYTFAFTEIIAALFLLASKGRRFWEFIARLITCYVVGLAVFVVIPIAGPYLYFPDSFDPQFQGSQTYSFMRSGFLEFESVRSGGPSMTGLGYFVGLPSLHTAIGILLLVTVRFSRLTFWVLVPINIAMILSTVLLGYHYVLDTVAGFAVAPLSIYIVSRIISLDPAVDIPHSDPACVR